MIPARPLRRFVLAGVALIAIGLFLIGAAHAQETHVGPATICDTKKQIEDFALMLVGDTDAATAVKAVNTAVNNPRACGIAVLAMVELEDVGRAKNDHGHWRIIKVAVVGIQTQEGWRRVEPFEQFTLVRLPGYSI